MDRILLCLVLLVGCGKGEKSTPNVFFAGEIVNPTSSHVVLYKGDMVIDSAKLDDQNRFSFCFDSLADGLYHFNHGRELQYVSLKQGDSLAIRLNTMAFDESLVFSGTGEEINNFLLELFLAHEEESSLVYSSFRLAPKEFSEILDSLARPKLDQLNGLKTEGVLTDKEVKIAKASIVYNYNTFREQYPFWHRKYTGDEKIKELPDGFYDYRKDLTYGDSDLTYLKPYYNFMNYHFGNISYMCCSKKCDIQNNEAKNQLHFNKHKLKLIDSIVQERELKDNLFRSVAVYYLLKAHDNKENNRVFIDRFRELSSNEGHIEEIDQLYQGILNIQPGEEIPEVYVYDLDGKKISLQEISSEKKTVFYFWSGGEKNHFKNITKRVRSLAGKNPDYKLVGININTDEANWKGLIKSADLNPSAQFRADNFEQLQHTLLIHFMNKCIITEDRKIVNAFSDIYSHDLEKGFAGTDKLAKN